MIIDILGSPDLSKNVADKLGNALQTKHYGVLIVVDSGSDPIHRIPQDLLSASDVILLNDGTIYQG